MSAQTWSDGHKRQRRVPASGYDGHQRRVILSVGDFVVLRETDPDFWQVTVEGDWSTMLDVAEAIIAADAEVPR